MIHYKLTSPESCHQWCYFQSTDPALDPTNLVMAGKGWIDSSTFRLYFRNAANTVWLGIGV